MTSLEAEAAAPERSFPEPCPLWERIWNGRVPTRKQLEKNHEDCRFERLDRWQAAEPPRDRDEIRPCECGRPDRWRCYWHFQRRYILRRPTRRTVPYVVYPDDLRIDQEIKAAAVRFIAVGDKPNELAASELPEEFRDLCAYLAEEVAKATNLRSDRNTLGYLRRFLVGAARTHMRRQQIPVEVNERWLQDSNFDVPTVHLQGDSDDPSDFDTLVTPGPIKAEGVYRDRGCHAETHNACGSYRDAAEGLFDNE